jgi:hypothetical protein
VRLDQYLYRRSGGMIGSLSQLVRGAAILAIEDGSEQISKKLLNSVPVDYAAERADTASSDAATLRDAKERMRSELGDAALRQYADKGSVLREDEVVRFALDALIRAAARNR